MKNDIESESDQGPPTHSEIQRTEKYVKPQGYNQQNPDGGKLCAANNLFLQHINCKKRKLIAYR